MRGEARPFKRRIEEHFDDIKAITESASTPELPADKRVWLKALTKSLKEAVGEFPPQVRAGLRLTDLASMHRAVEAGMVIQWGSQRG